jgi:HAD domain in Swiss Army Knife RNA repair proteins
MNVIFLDIDGVLNSDATPNPRKFPYIVDPGLLGIFKDLVRRTGATVVLSSSWRTDPVGLLAAKFYAVPFMDVCPDLPGVSRCEEMLQWLSAHQEVHRFVVIDDESDCLDDLPLFQPSARTGITTEIADGVVEYLCGRTDQTMRQPALVRLGQNIHSMFKRDKS